MEWSEAVTVYEQALQRFLRDQGVLCNSPKECFRQAFAFGLVQDDPLWIRMMEDRNLTVHTYNERTAKKIYHNLRDYLPLYEELLRGFSRYLSPQ